MALFQPSDDERNVDRDIRLTGLACLCVIAVGVFAILIYALQWTPVGFAAIFGGSLMLLLASVSGGFCLGFLFGIPRTLQGNSAPPAPAPAVPAGGLAAAPPPNSGSELTPNTNLEQISDWLTKIIVGLGLINLEKLPAKVRSMISQIAPTVGGQYGYALAILIGYSVLGFLYGYLVTRLYLTNAFRRADKALNKIRQEVESSGDQAARTFTGTGPGTDPVSPEQLAAVAKVKELAQNVDSNQLRAQVRALAREYELIRLSMPAGPERTRQMENVAGKMRALSEAAYSTLPELVRSNSSGERLAAISFLEIKPSSDFLPWLADRVAQEAHPFMRYHAAWALARARFVLPRDQQGAVSRAVERALEQERSKPEDERDDGTIQTLEKALSPA